MAKAKSVAEKILTVKAFGAFSGTIKIPYAVSRHPSGFSNWVLRNFAIRPYAKEKPRGKVLASKACRMTTELRKAAKARGK